MFRTDLSLEKPMPMWYNGYIDMMQKEDDDEITVV